MIYVLFIREAVLAIFSSFLTNHVYLYAIFKGEGAYIFINSFFMGYRKE